MPSPSPIAITSVSAPAAAAFERFISLSASRNPESRNIIPDHSVGVDRCIHQLPFTNLPFTLEFPLLLAQPPIRVSVLTKKGRLLISGLGTTPSQYAPIGDGLFQQIEGHQQVAFQKDASGNVARLSVDALPFMGTERIPWYEVPSFWYTVLGVSVLLFLTVFTNLFYRRKEIRGMARRPKLAIWLSVAAAAWFFLTAIVIAVVLSVNRSTLLSHIPESLKVALVMPVIFVLLTVLLLIVAVQAWRASYWTTGRRVHFTLVALAAVAVCLFFNQWNLLGWRFG